jgi:GNAT superfamily N-acetyltransferase
VRIDVREESMAALDAYATISIAFAVDRVLDVAVMAGGLGGLSLIERRLTEPVVKDYDAIEGEGPTRWARRFDLAHWGLLAAYADDARVGGAVLAFDTPGVHMLEDRTDLAVLWDLRVSPEWRARGVGHRLFTAAEQWAAQRGCAWLKVETQNVNVTACEFYAGQGCVLGAIDRFAYPDFPDEAQLLWYKALTRAALPEAG